VLASRRLFSGDHDDTPPVSLIAILSPRTGTITAPNQVIVQGVSSNPTTIWKVSLSIKGVTYTACSNRVLQKLKELDFVGEFAVNFVQINAVVELFDKD
jgi:hypothetical protein